MKQMTRSLEAKNSLKLDKMWRVNLFQSLKNNSSESDTL